jgi:hypothetical protein
MLREGPSNNTDRGDIYHLGVLPLWPCPTSLWAEICFPCCLKICAALGTCSPCLQVDSLKLRVHTWNSRQIATLLPLQWDLAVFGAVSIMEAEPYATDTGDGDWSHRTLSPQRTKFSHMEYAYSDNFPQCPYSFSEVCLLPVDPLRRLSVIRWCSIREQEHASVSGGRRTCNPRAPGCN